MWAEDVMIPFQNIIHTPPDSTLSFTTSLVLQYNVSSCLIAQEDKYYGFVTKKDLLEAFHLSYDPRTKVREIMKKNTELVFVKQDSTLDRIADLMLSRGCHHVLVKNAMGNVIGLISTIDLVKTMSNTSRIPIQLSLPKLLSLATKQK